MSVKAIVKDVADSLAGQGARIDFTTREGTWTAPATVEFDYGGQHHVLQFWSGSYSDKQVASSIYEDVVAIINPQGQR